MFPFFTLKGEIFLSIHNKRNPNLGPLAQSQDANPFFSIEGLCPLPSRMAEFRQVPGGRETPQGEIRPEVVEDELTRSPVSEEPQRGRSNSNEAKLSPREEEELDPRIQVRRFSKKRDFRLPELLSDDYGTRLFFSVHCVGKVVTKIIVISICTYIYISTIFL